MSVGAKLGNGLDLGGFIAAVVIGGAILAVYTGFLAHIGARTGLGMDLMAHHAFGTRGSFLPSALIGLTGGMSNPFALLMLVPVTIAATALGDRQTVMVGVVTVVMISLAGWLAAPLDHPTLDLTMPDGRRRRYGAGGGPQVAVRLTDPALPRRLVLSPDLALGEGDASVPTPR